ncbi:Methyltransferase domain containing protein [uncultured Caudovirales phage]|uniref:Methyltransferase domain containing protein n=1 Tax=uncultured Caudovirales phage TaxID=2100421 RepID=A0A6J7WGL5_9CAUD|nr:Methyltransferase domain containing protein [uncultured Caudovirales phage]
MEHFYQHIQGWHNAEDVYSRAVENYPSGSHFVEVGSWRGRSAAHMAVLIANSGKQIKFDCVDTWRGTLNEELHQNDPSVVNDTIYDEFLANMKPVEGYYTAIRMPSVEAAKLYADASLDFVYIDADHEYEGILADIKAWLPKVKPNGGVIAGDDYGHAQGSEGVQRAVREIFGDDFMTNGLGWGKNL